MDPSFLFIIAAMFAIMYLLLIRPQRQQQRRHAEMLAALKPGDEVITAGGIYGDVTGVEDDRVLLEIAEDVEIEVAKRAITSIVPPDEYGEEAREPEPEATPVADEAERERIASDDVREEDTARR